MHIRSGTYRLKPFNKSCKLLLRFRFTRLINERSPWLFVDLGRPVRGFFSIFSCWSNLLKNVDTVDRLNRIIFPTSVFLVHLGVSRLHVVLLFDRSPLFFLAILETPFFSLYLTLFIVDTGADCFAFIRVVFPMIPVSLDCPFLNAPSAGGVRVAHHFSFLC